MKKSETERVRVHCWVHNLEPMRQLPLDRHPHVRQPNEEAGVHGRKSDSNPRYAMNAHKLSRRPRFSLEVRKRVGLHMGDGCDPPCSARLKSRIVTIQLAQELAQRFLRGV